MNASGGSLASATLASCMDAEKSSIAGKKTQILTALLPNYCIAPSVAEPRRMDRTVRRLAHASGCPVASVLGYGSGMGVNLSAMTVSQL